MKIYNGKKEVVINNFKEVGSFGKIKGLMFSRREKAKILLFDFNKQVKISIHSLFVFFPFLALWLDKNNKVVYWRIIYPWKISILPQNPFYKLIEVPLNKKNEAVIKFIVGKESFKYD